ncbi:MAG TPA: hypothetical protein VE153_41480 [Myxococcus sp.]|nr:hypothetical protein [Myxococcus sp.]
MSRITIAVLVLVSTGCATTGGGGGGSDGNANIAGVIRLPESGLRQAGTPCDQLQVVVSSPGTPAMAMGRASVRTSRAGRCSFNVSGVPSNTELQVGVTAAASLKCDNGAAPTFAPAPSPVTLKNHATATRDFTLSCGS